MKQVILIFSFLFCLSISGYSQDPINPPPKKSTRVQPPIAIVQDGSNLKVCFLKELGTITLTVENGVTATIYENTVNATTGDNLVIDANLWPYGTYTVRITNGEGDLVYIATIEYKE